MLIHMSPSYDRIAYAYKQVPIYVTIYIIGMRVHSLDPKLYILDIA